MACCYFKYKIKFDVQLDLVKKCEYVQYKALQLSVNLSINKQKKEPHKVIYMYAAHFSIILNVYIHCKRIFVEIVVMFTENALTIG